MYDLNNYNWADEIRAGDGYKNVMLGKPSDALYILAEELYQSENAITDENIDIAMLALCDMLGLDADELKNGLQVVHWKEVKKCRMK